MLPMVCYSRRPQSGQITCYFKRTYHVLPTHHCSTSCQRQALTDIVTAKHFTWISRRRGTRSARHPRTIRNRFGALVLACLLSGFSSAFAQNPVPFVNQPLVPAAVAPGGPGFTLTIHGTGFVLGASVRWNGTLLTTTFVSSSQLTATVPAANIATAGTTSMTVVNPGTSAASNVVFLSIIAPSPNVFYSNAPGSPIYLGGTGVATNEPLSMAAGDFNGDGKLDLALGIQEDGNPGYVSVLLGNGDGTFTPVSSSPATGHCPCSMAVGDINGDGKLLIFCATVSAWEIQQEFAGTS